MTRVIYVCMECEDEYDAKVIEDGKNKKRFVETRICPTCAKSMGETD